MSVRDSRHVDEQLEHGSLKMIASFVDDLSDFDWFSTRQRSTT